MCSVAAFELIVDDWLGASFDASGVVSHWVHACLGWVDLDNLFRFRFISLQLSV